MAGTLAELPLTRHRNGHCRVCQGRDSGEEVKVVNPFEDLRSFTLTIFSHGCFLETPVFWMDVVCEQVFDGVRTPESMRITYLSDPLLVGIDRSNNKSDYLVKCMRRCEVSPGNEIVVEDGAALRIVHRASSDFWQCSWPVAHITRKELP